MQYRSLGRSGLKVSVMTMGTMTFGGSERIGATDQQNADRQIDLCLDHGINLLDTAPAYGNSEARLGQLLPCRNDWVIVTKVGEEFSAGTSHFDFSGKHTLASIERSLRLLRSDYLDIVLIHSDGNDLAILEQGDCVAALMDCKARGLVRAVGMSTKTIAGGLRAVRELDVVMLTCNLQQQDTEALALARQLNKGVLVKKGLMSGHVQQPGRDLVQESMQLVLGNPAVHSMIAGTINPAHLAANVAAAKTVTGP